MDPITAASPSPDDIRPVVASTASNRAVWIFGGALAVGAAGLFLGLESRRTPIAAPATAPQAGMTGGMIASPPELEIPAPHPQQQPIPLALVLSGPIPSSAPAVDQRAGRPGRAQISAVPQNPYVAGLPIQPFTPPAPGPTVVYRAGDGSRAANGPLSPQAPGEGDAQGGQQRVRASTFANPATTVPQGAVIQAVLETALDSTRPGLARAIVSRDVRGFDGTKVLIPRGSRIYGEYKSDLSAGQNRALIRWQRLMRPDGVIIEIDSPVADPLGRAGVGGKVNTHFLARFGGAILQSSLDLGVGLATRSITNGTVIVPMPGSTVQGGANQIIPQEVRPTLKVKQGASVSVFVARDLDFSTVEQ